LRAHEGGAARAHLIERHVGKTTAELQERLAGSKRMQGCSSFYDRAQAEAAVSKTLAANEAKIAEWLKGGATDRLPIKFNPGGPAFPVGLHLARGASEVVAVAGVKVVLIKDATTSCGFRILTGFPVP
jgi:hypothetical protein